MAAPFFIPFNYQPVSVQRGSASYTVPAGKYAQVVVSVSGSAWGSATSGAGSSATISNDSFNHTVTLWLRAGDVMSFTKTSAGVGPTAGSPAVSITSGSSVVISVNSTIVSSFDCVASVFIAPESGSAITVSATITGGTNAFWQAHEYSEIT